MPANRMPHSPLRSPRSVTVWVEMEDGTVYQWSMGGAWAVSLSADVRGSVVLPAESIDESAVAMLFPETMNMHVAAEGCTSVEFTKLPHLEEMENGA